MIMSFNTGVVIQRESGKNARLWLEDFWGRQWNKTSLRRDCKIAHFCKVTLLASKQPIKQWHSAVFEVLFFVACFWSQWWEQWLKFPPWQCKDWPLHCVTVMKSQDSTDTGQFHIFELFHLYPTNREKEVKYLSKMEDSKQNKEDLVSFWLKVITVGT